MLDEMKRFEISHILEYEKLANFEVFRLGDIVRH